MSSCSVLVSDSCASRGLCLPLLLQLHIGLILCCRVSPTEPHYLVHDKEKCSQNPDRCFLLFSYGPMNPGVCNCLTVVITPSVRKHCSMYLKQYCAGILQSSNLSSFNWAVWSNEKQWMIVLVVQAPLCAEVALDWAPFYSHVQVREVLQISC